MSRRWRRGRGKKRNFLFACHGRRNEGTISSPTHAVSSYLLFHLFSSYALSTNGDLSSCSISPLFSTGTPSSEPSPPTSTLLRLSPCLLHAPQRWPNNFTYPFVLKMCAAAAVGTSFCCMVHACVLATGLDLDPYIQSSLIHMYSEGKDLAGATWVFDGCGNIVGWNPMLDGYVKTWKLGRARMVFGKMKRRHVDS